MIDFKSFLTEEITESSAIVESVVDSSVLSSVNDALYKNLDAPVLTPHAGIQEIRKILLMYGIDMPAIFELDDEGDELVLDANSYGDAHLGLLYILYSLSDEGYYEFYAEVTDEAGIEKLLADGADEQVE